MNINEQPWLVAISAGRWQMNGIRAALDAGMRVFALDGDENAPGLQLATKSAVIDIKNIRAVLTLIESSEIKPSGVVSFVSEVGMPAAAAIRERYNLTGPDRVLTDTLTNKIRQRELWEKAGIPGPRWHAFTTVAEAEMYAKAIGFPCVIKPNDSAGSRGVSKLDVQELVNTSAKKALEVSRSGMALVESYMIGTEYTVETFGDGRKNHVLAVTEKIKVPGTNGTVAQELATPEIDKKAEIVAAAAVDALDALGYVTGPGHTEVILDTANKPGLVEAAGRGGGFMVFDRLVEKASGFNILKATALQAIGLSPETILRNKQAVVLRFFPSRPGVVSKIEGFDEACRIPGVEAGTFVSIGERVGDVRGDGDRLGYILSGGRTPAEAKAAADRAGLLIHIDVK